MKLFNRNEISQLQNEVEYLQFVVDNDQSYFEKISYLVEELQKYQHHIKDDNKDNKHYLYLMELIVFQLELKLNNQKLDRMNAKYSRGDK